MIETSHDGPVCTITLNRPDKANALTRDMLEALIRAVADADQAGSTVLILTGKGRVFSAGADLDAARTTDLTTDPAWERLSGRISDFPGLTIAALNGTVAGGALGMMLACDLRIAIDGAKVFYPVLRNGFLPQPSDPARMRALIGLGRTKMVLLAGQKIDTETASAWGLFDKVVAADALMAQAQALAKDAMSAPQTLVAQIKGLCDGTTTEAQ